MTDDRAADNGTFDGTKPAAKIGCKKAGSGTTGGGAGVRAVTLVGGGRCRGDSHGFWGWIRVRVLRRPHGFQRARKWRVRRPHGLWRARRCREDDRRRNNDSALA
jgi:hypothetical protein